jgi:CBS domain-containing protein
MTPEPRSVPKSTPLSDVALMMRDADIGEVLVADGDRLCGLVTDRDIVVRALASGNDPQTTEVDAICTHDLVTLAPDDTVDDALDKMSRSAVRRLPVIDHGRAVGIVSLGDISQAHDSGATLEDISEAPPNQ